MMQSLVVGPSAWFRRLQWLAVGISLAVAAWLAATGHAWAAAAALAGAWWAGRTRQDGLELRLRGDGICELRDGRATRVAGVFSAAGWLVLRLAENRNRARVVVLAPDAASAEELRRLRVWLRWAAPRGNLNSRETPWS